ncbi:tetratricopeptide repeat protein [Pontibacter sp. 13R65]|uniref:tetratricopeptide repeat protein n=1 Tax=Pontibacter sp. 13R65 TaxID=3127458 RepID=UPI00301E586F
MNDCLTLFNDGKHKEAIQCIQDKLQDEYESAVLWFYLGVMYSKTGLYEQAVGAYEMAIKLDPNDASAYFNKGRVYIEFYVLFSDANYLDDALACFFRTFYINCEEIQLVPKLLKHTLQYFDTPHFAVKIILLYPHLLLDSPNSRQLEEVIDTHNNYENRMVQFRKELKANGSKGDDLKREFYLYKAIAELMGGDPIIAYQYHDNILDELWEDNLQHQYYYALNAASILHPNTKPILDYAEKTASIYLETDGQDEKQSYYAACIQMLQQQYDNAITIFKSLTEKNYLPAYFKLVECYHLSGRHEQKSKLAKDINKDGLHLKLVERNANATITANLEHEIMLFETQTGWYLAGMVVDKLDEELLANGGTRPHTYDANDKRLLNLWQQERYPEATKEEKLEMSPEKLIELIDSCKKATEKLFEEYEAKEKVDDNELANELLVYMEEENEAGSVILVNYLNIVTYCYMTSKISKLEYTLVQVFLTIRSKEFNLKNDPNLLRLILKSSMTEVVAKAMDAFLGGPYVALITKITQHFISGGVFRGKSYGYFRRNFNPEIKNTEFETDWLRICMTTVEELGNLEQD